MRFYGRRGEVKEVRYLEGDNYFNCKNRLDQPMGVHSSGDLL